MSDKSTNTSRSFILISGIWIFTLGLIRYFHRPYGLDFDGAEQTYLSQWLEMGSGIQPPLPTWIFYFVYDWFGYSVAHVHAIRLSLIFLIYAGFYRLCQKLLKDQKLAVINTLSLVFIFQFSSVMLKQMHTVFITLAVIYSWLSLLNIYERGRVRSYLWLGFWIGIGLLSKYNFIVHIGALLLAIITLPPLRNKLVSYKILLTFILALMICSTHYWWLLDNFNTVRDGINQDLTENSNSDRLGDLITGISAFIIKVIAFAGPLVFVFLLFFFKPFKKNFKRGASLEFKLIERYMIISFIALIAIIIISRSTVYHEHWLQPFFLIFPILLFQKLKGIQDNLRPKLKLYKFICMALFFLISIDFAFKSYVKIYTGHPSSVFNIPYKSMADLIVSYAPECDVIFTRDVNTAGHMKLLLPDKLILVDNDIKHMRLESDCVLRYSNPVFIWQVKDENKSIPIGAARIQEAVNQGISVDIVDSKQESLNYIFSEEKAYEVGLAKIRINNE